MFEGLVFILEADPVNSSRRHNIKSSSWNPNRYPGSRDSEFGRRLEKPIDSDRSDIKVIQPMSGRRRIDKRYHCRYREVDLRCFETCSDSSTLKCMSMSNRYVD